MTTSVSPPHKEIAQSTNELEIFKHTPLQEGQNRLVVISPGSFDDPIDVRIHAGLFDPSSPPIYAALSYVWGPPDPPVQITLNKKAYHITSNLAAAIRRIRHPTNDLVYWIDALCIDQTNIPERNSQVRLMRHFYECALHVIIYLGEETDTSDTALRIIRKLAEIAYYSSDARDCPATFAEFKIATLKAELPRYDSPDWRAFDDFFCRAWFGRIWVFQEAVVGKADPGIFVGQKVVTWSMIGVAVDWFHGTGGYKGIVNFEETRDDWSYHALLIHNCRWDLQIREKRVSFLYTLTNSRNFQATDERDKVFALVGLRDRLWDKPGGVEFAIDYGRRTEEVFRDVARHIVEDTMSLDILASVEDLSGRERNDLPSWAPDWTKQLGCMPFATETNPSKYNACGESAVVMLEKNDANVLAILGLCVDEITEVAAPFAADRYKGSEGPPETHTVLRRQWDEIACKLDPYPSGGLPLDAYWRTLIGNADRLRRPVGDEYFYHFARFVHLLPGEPSGITTAVKESLAARVFDNHDEVEEGSDEPQIKRRVKGEGALYGTAIMGATVGRRFFATKKGFMGIGPVDIKSGDKVYVFSGANVPFILREYIDDPPNDPIDILEPAKNLTVQDTDAGQRGNDQVTVTRLVGDAYIHGIMNGESIPVEKDGTVKWQEVYLR